MGASASTSKNIYCSKGYYYQLTASFTENSTNTTNNTSNITVTGSLASVYQGGVAPSWSSNYTSTFPSHQKNLQFAHLHILMAYPALR